MAKRYAVGSVRAVGVIYGSISLSGGVAIFVLFVGHPANLVYLLPPWLGRMVLNAAPWLLTTGSGQGASTSVLVPFLAALVFVGFGLWSLAKALFGSDFSLPTAVRFR